MAPRVLSITGMHRSGTSLVASWVQACGLPIHRGRVWGPAEGNELGHFEDADFGELHHEAILRRWPSSLGWIAEEPVLAFGTEERERARALVRERRRQRVWGWKDPRSVLFLDEWFRLVRHLDVLIVTRPREHVVDSLLRRAAIASTPNMVVDARQAVAAHDVYEAAVERAQAQHPDQVLVVPLHDLLRDDRPVFEELQRRLRTRLRHVPVSVVHQPDRLRR